MVNMVKVRTLILIFVLTRIATDYTNRKSKQVQTIILMLIIPMVTADLEIVLPTTSKRRSQKRLFHHLALRRSCNSLLQLDIADCF